MTKGQMIVSIVVALIGLLGAATGGTFAFAQFMIKRKDENNEEALKKMIAKMISEADDRLRGEFNDGLTERENTGRERFDINSKQIQENSKQLAENGRQIEEILGIVKDQAQKYDTMADSLTALNKVVSASAESQCNANYDRLLIVTNKVLKSGKMTISDKTNIKQLYKSWKELGGSDPTGKMETMYEECMSKPLSMDEM